MKIDVTKKIKGIDGVKPLPNPDGKGIPLTLKDICINSLLAPDDEKQTGKKKYTDYELFVKLRDATKEVDLSSEEISRIKEKGVPVLGVLIYGQIVDMLEQKENKTK